MSDLIDRNLIAELVDSHGNVHWEDIAGLPSEQPDVRTQMSSADCISRQAAIEALAKEMPSLTTPDGCGEFDREIQIAAEAFVDCMQIINGLPSAQPERDTPIKPIETTDTAWRIPHRQAVCPKCDYYLGHVAFLGDYKGKRITYCETCGQAIDWEGWDFDE